MKQLLCVAIVAAVLGCGASSGEPAPVITPQPGKELCRDACNHMASATVEGGPCEEASDVPLADGGTMSCYQFCVYQHENGIFWNTECLTKITACSQIDACSMAPSP